MLEFVHQHIIEEIRTNTRTDTIFVLTSILLNLIVLAINSGFAEGDDPNLPVMAVFTLLTAVVNIAAVIGLLKGRQTRAKLVEGLLSMYRDNKVDNYYDASLLKAYQVRYLLFLIVVAATGAVAVVVPFVLL